MFKVIEGGGGLGRGVSHVQADGSMRGVSHVQGDVGGGGGVRRVR